MVKYADILGKIAKKQGARPSQPGSDSGDQPQRTRQVPIPDSLSRQYQPGVTGPVSDPTEHISKSVMARLFSSVLESPPEAHAAPLPATLPAAGAIEASVESQSRRTRPVKGFRNHAELLKFASLLINDVEDLMKARA